MRRENPEKGLFVQGPGEQHDTTDILNILQEIERGTLKLDDAEKFLDEIYA